MFYALNLVSFCTACLLQILDLVPTVARLYFLERLPASLSYGQAAILLCLGLQHQQLEHLEGQLKLPGGQILALFNKTIRRLHTQLHKAASKDIEAALPRLREVCPHTGYIL